jgi:hypothetical protein
MKTWLRIVLTRCMTTMYVLQSILCIQYVSQVKQIRELVTLVVPMQIICI